MATLEGVTSPLPTGMTVEVEETWPLEVRISLAAPLVSATKTLPPRSTATPVGEMNPLPTGTTLEEEETEPPDATISFTAPA